mgnify:CR=1 FL=1
MNCPRCGYEIDPLEVRGDEDLVAIIKLQPVFGQHASAVWAYLEQFNLRPLAKRTKKLRLLLEEMAGLFQTGRFQFQKKVFEISQDGIGEVLATVAKKHFETPLDGHNYLKKCMIAIAEREREEASRRAERDLRRREDELRGAGRISEEEARRNRESVRGIIKGLGG